MSIDELPNAPPRIPLDTQLTAGPQLSTEKRVKQWKPGWRAVPHSGLPNGLVVGVMSLILVVIVVMLGTVALATHLPPTALHALNLADDVGSTPTPAATDTPIATDTPAPTPTDAPAATHVPSPVASFSHASITISSSVNTYTVEYTIVTSPAAPAGDITFSSTFCGSPGGGASGVLDGGGVLSSTWTFKADCASAPFDVTITFGGYGNGHAMTGSATIHAPAWTA